MEAPPGFSTEHHCSFSFNSAAAVSFFEKRTDSGRTLFFFTQVETLDFSCEPVLV
jgi:hypothetical protein